MLLLITYDVNTENEAGKKRLRKVANNVKTMGEEYRTPYLSALWIRHKV